MTTCEYMKICPQAIKDWCEDRYPPACSCYKQHYEKEVERVRKIAKERWEIEMQDIGIIRNVEKQRSYARLL